MDTRNTSLRLGAATAVAFTAGASSPSEVLFTGKTTGLYVLRVQVDQDCTIAVGTSPVATASSTAMPAGAVEYFNVCPEEKVAVYGKTAAGTLSLTEMS